MNPLSPPGVPDEERASFDSDLPQPEGAFVSAHRPRNPTYDEPDPAEESEPSWAEAEDIAPASTPEPDEAAAPWSDAGGEVDDYTDDYVQATDEPSVSSVFIDWLGKLCIGIVLMMIAIGAATGFTSWRVGQTVPTPTGSPTAASRDAGRALYQDMGGRKDWNYRSGPVQLQATWVSGVDYATCADIDATGKLAQYRCRNAAESTHSAENGQLLLTQYLFALPDEARAGAAATSVIPPDVRTRPDTTIDGATTRDARVTAEKNMVLLTIVTATAAVPPSTVDTYLTHRHGDTLGALSLR
ncbi:hypothetical protein [Tsukamurella strandjordii]|uniref:hypothetical protein n=1 Tax=Tsukamurella strandjordii TaxID=147577 RepID=UPI0031DCB6E6